MIQFDTCFVQGSRDLDCGHDSNDAIVVAAIRYRIDMRSSHDRREAVDASRTATHEVSGYIHLRSQPGLKHQSGQVSQRDVIVTAVGDAVGTAFVVLAETAHVLHGVIQAVAVHPDVRCLGDGTCREQGQANQGNSNFHQVTCLRYDLRI